MGKLRQKAVIKPQKNGSFKIETIRHSNCHCCPAKSVCMDTGDITLGKKMLKDLQLEGCDNQEIELSITHEQGFFAVVIAYIMPVLLMISTMLIVEKYYTEDQGIMGLMALASMLSYFLLLSLFRSALKNYFKIAALKK